MDDFIADVIPSLCFFEESFKQIPLEMNLLMKGNRHRIDTLIPQRATSN